MPNSDAQWVIGFILAAAIGINSSLGDIRNQLRELRGRDDWHFRTGHTTIGSLPFPPENALASRSMPELAGLGPSGRRVVERPFFLDNWYYTDVLFSATQPDPGGQTELGVLYATGQGVPEDAAEAASWFRRAAEQGDARAQNNLGLMYTGGEGVEQDSAKAVSWFRRAAEQGDALAQNNLGVLYANGQSVSRDTAEAVRWFQLAAKQEDALAQNNLGVMYANGQGVQRDLFAAGDWLARAEVNGYTQAHERRDVLVNAGWVRP